MKYFYHTIAIISVLVAICFVCWLVVGIEGLSAGWKAFTVVLIWICMPTVRRPQEKDDEKRNE